MKLVTNFQNKNTQLLVNLIQYVSLGEIKEHVLQLYISL